MSNADTTRQCPAAESHGSPLRDDESPLLPVSVHILTWNSGATLQRTLESVRPCREILVIDGGSTDDTLVIAREFGARVIPQRPPAEQGRPTTDFSAARNAGLRAATEPWILALDSDEAASAELLEDIRRSIARGEPCAALVPRRYVLEDGRIVTRATTYPNARLYFFHRDTVTGWIKPVHERPARKPGTPVRHFRGASLAPLGSAEDYKRKNLRYLAMEAESDRGRGWEHWMRFRVLRAVRGRLIAAAKLLWIWCLPHRGSRLPLRHELLRFWYAWKLIVETCPAKKWGTHTYTHHIRTMLDRYYRHIRPFRFLWGWAVDTRRRMCCSRRAEEWRARGFRGAKLDICGGRNPLNPEEYLSVDIVALPQVDLVFDIRKAFPIPPGVIAEIFSAATLEHFRERDNLHILREFFRILRPGGLLRVSTPDVEAIARAVLAGEDLRRINQHLFGKFKGSATEDCDVHRWMYPAATMIGVLREIGFEDIERIPMDIGLHDPTLHYLIRARKPSS